MDTLTYISFLVRMWRERGPQPQETMPDWCSEVEHIQSGRKWDFGTLGELLDFLQQVAEDPEALSHCREQGKDGSTSP